ncbi:MAG TPA: DUF3667 domain-containing protein [Flavisolibacter sp.]|nr:DUF3667 domain-containing protein [Flavisolibacter sp.]
MAHEIRPAPVQPQANQTIPLTATEQITARHTCKNCQRQFEGKYCTYCGEKVYTDHDRTFSHFIQEGFHFITHFEGTFFTTLKYIFTRPGKLSEQYCYGIRKSLFKPLSLFLLLCILYLLFPVFEGLNMRLYYHVRHNFYGDYAMQKAIALAQEHRWTDQQLAEVFQERSAKVSKFLLLVLLPLTALFFWALTFRKRKFFFDQMVFATEINSVYLIWGYLVLPLLLFGAMGAYHLATGNKLVLEDGWITMGSIYSVFLLYTAIAAHRFYKLSWLKSVGLALLFFVAHYFILVIYKFFLFLITTSLL